MNNNMRKGRRRKLARLATSTRRGAELPQDPELDLEPELEMGIAGMGYAQ